MTGAEVGKLLLTNGGDKCGVLTNTDSFCQSKSQVVPLSTADRLFRNVCLNHFACVVWRWIHVSVWVRWHVSQIKTNVDQAYAPCSCRLKRKSWVWFAILPRKLSDCLIIAQDLVHMTFFFFFWKPNHQKNEAMKQPPIWCAQWKWCEYNLKFVQSDWNVAKLYVHTVRVQ